MTQEQVLEGNELIAKFMRLTQGRPNEIRWKHDWFDDNGAVTGKRETHLLFHSDWNWLMAVVERIESICEDNTVKFAIDIFGKSCSVTEVVKPQMIFDISAKECNSKKEAVFKAVIEFIEWHYSKLQPKELPSGTPYLYACNKLFLEYIKSRSAGELMFQLSLIEKDMQEKHPKHWFHFQFGVNGKYTVDIRGLHQILSATDSSGYKALEEEIALMFLNNDVVNELIITIK